MTLPNKITICRLLLVPFIIGFMIFDDVTTLDTTIGTTYLSLQMTWPILISLLLFALAAFSDFLDGFLARKNNQVSTFGKVFDPSVDKILINTTLILMAIRQWVPSLIVIIFISRDILVDTTRIALGKKNVVLPANFWGKLKTITQIFAILFLFIIHPVLENSQQMVFMATNWWSLFPLYFATCFSILSGYKYLQLNWKDIKE